MHANMAAKNQQVHSQDDDDEFDFDEDTTSIESDRDYSKELEYKKNMRQLYLVAVIVFILTVAILVFSVAIFHINSPKFRIRSIIIDELSMNSLNNTIDMKFKAEIGIKSSNFGDFDYERTSVSFFNRGTYVALVNGDALVEKGKVKARSTKKISFLAEMGATNSIYVDDMESRYLTLTAKATMNGTLHMMKLIKRKRSSEMNCTININMYKKIVLDIQCK
ncbi:hypothetical protein CsatB_002751 [Cannabis sativa]